MKIAFDIKYRDKIESGEYKVETRDGKSVRIICWDMDSYNNIVALVANYPNYNGSLSEHIFSYGMDGRYSTPAENAEDLFIVTPEPEMSELELAIAKYRPPTDSKDTIQRIATELLDLAKHQLLQSGELLTQEHHEKLMETLREECKKDLPRWRVWRNGACGNSVWRPIALVYGADGIRFVSCLGANGEKYIMLDDLKKLPGFNDEHHE